MKTAKSCLKVYGFVLAMLTIPMLAAGQGDEQSSGDWRNQICLTYVSGLSDLVDAIEKNYYASDSWEWPVGISYQGYFLMPSGFGLGGSIGPVIGVFGDVSALVIPLGVDLRYNIQAGESVSINLRAGARYPIVTGDYMEGSSMGFVGAVALEFPFKNNNMAWGIEASYDTSEVEVEAGSTIEDVRPYEFGLSVFFRF